MAARISEIFLCKEYRKCFFFYTESKLNNTKKTWRLGGEGVGVWLG